MPMIDAFIPEGALKAQAEATLISEVTDILLQHEKDIDPSNPVVRSVSVVFLHRPKVFVAGQAADRPRYRFITSVPEGQYDGEDVLASLVRQVTEAVARAEGASFEDVAPRVWIFPNEVRDGLWGGRGVIRRLTQILTLFSGDAAGERARLRLARRRKEQATAMLRALLEGDLGSAHGKS